MNDLNLQLGNSNLFDYLLIILMIFFLVFFTLTNRSQRRKESVVKKPDIKTELVCVECGLKEIRNFKEGDVLSKTTEEKCKKCGGNMRIDLIYSVEIEKKK